jgi:hypothetical protein
MLPCQILNATECSALWLIYDILCCGHDDETAHPLACPRIVAALHHGHHLCQHWGDALPLLQDYSLAKGLAMGCFPDVVVAVGH